MSLFVNAQAFDQGNEFYKNGKYQDAVTTYESILSSGKHSVDLYFNLGNAYYKLNKVAPAIYNYEKALILSPNNKEVKTNLSFAQNMVIDEFKDSTKAGFKIWLHQYTGILSYDSWAKIAIVFSILFLGGFIGYYFSGTIKSKRIYFGVLVTSVAISFLFVVVATFEKQYILNDNPAIVFAEVTSVVSEPTSMSKEVFKLHEGSKVWILDEVDQFSKIEINDGSQGWINSSDIKRIK